MKYKNFLLNASLMSFLSVFGATGDEEKVQKDRALHFPEPFMSYDILGGSKGQDISKYIYIKNSNGHYPPWCDAEGREVRLPDPREVLLMEKSIHSQFLPPKATGEQPKGDASKK